MKKDEIIKALKNKDYTIKTDQECWERNTLYIDNIKIASHTRDGNGDGTDHMIISSDDDILISLWIPWSELSIFNTPAGGGRPKIN